MYVCLCVCERVYTCLEEVHSVRWWPYERIDLKWCMDSVKDLVQTSNEQLKSAIADATQLPVLVFCVLAI